MLHASRRRLLERRLKDMLLEEAARQGLEPAMLAEWLFEEHGVRARGDWRSLREAVLRSEVTAQELAVFLLDSGVTINEKRWIEILREGSIADYVPRIPEPEGHEAGGSSDTLGGKRGEAEGRRGTGSAPCC